MIIEQLKNSDQDETEKLKQLSPEQLQQITNSQVVEIDSRLKQELAQRNEILNSSGRLSASPEGVANFSGRASNFATNEAQHA